VLLDVRASGDFQTQKTPSAATEEDLAASVHSQVQEEPEVALPEVRAVCELQMQNMPAAVTEGKVAATTHLHMEELSGATEIVAHTDVFRAEKIIPVNSPVVGVTSAPVGALAEKRVMGDMPSAPPVLYHGNYDVWGEHSVNSFGFPYEMEEETSGTLCAVIREVGKPKIGHDLWPATHPAIYQAGSVTNQEGSNDDEGDETPAGRSVRSRSDSVHTVLVNQPGQPEMAELKQLLPLHE